MSENIKALIVIVTVTAVLSGCSRTRWTSVVRMGRSGSASLIVLITTGFSITTSNTVVQNKVSGETQ